MKSIMNSTTGAVLALGLSLAGTASAQNALPTGRTASAIENGVYPASYFPNTEILGADEMRITALGTGMPNQTKAPFRFRFM